MNSPIEAKMGIKEWIMLFILSVLWGGSFFLIELVVTELPTLLIVLFRVVLAAVTLWIFVFYKGLAVPTSLSLWRQFIIMGLINNVLPFSLIIWGQTHITSGLASILNSTAPLFTVFIAGVWLQDEKISKNKLLGAIFGFLGTIVMVGSSVFDGFGVKVFAQLAILGAALSYSFAGVYGRRFKAQGVHPVIAAAGQVSASALVLFPVVLMFDGFKNISVPGIQVVVALVVLAVLSTAVAYVLYFQILASSGATNLVLVTFLIPVSAVLFGTIILGEKLQLVHVLGMGIIAIGLVAIDGRLWSKWKSGKESN
ncbi:MAG: DMT family transporter [bacterium]|nr:DMT family transporter [bacterium]